MASSKKEHLLGLMRDAVADICYYDRQDDEELSSEDVEQLLWSGEVTPEEMAAVFMAEIREQLPIQVND